MLFFPVYLMWFHQNWLYSQLLPIQIQMTIWLAFRIAQSEIIYYAKKKEQFLPILLDMVFWIWFSQNYTGSDIKEELVKKIKSLTIAY